MLSPFCCKSSSTQRGDDSSFSWTSLVKSPAPRTLCLGDPTLSRTNQVISVSMCETVLCATKSATKPPNTKTLACMYLQEEPSTPPSDQPPGDTDEATNPDEFTQVNSHHTYMFQKTGRKLNVVSIGNHEFTGLDVVTYLGKESSNHSPGQMEAFKTQVMTSSFPFMTLVDYHFCSYPRHESPCKEHKCPAHPHLHSTLDQSYQNHLTTSLQECISEPN